MAGSAVIDDGNILIRLPWSNAVLLPCDSANRTTTLSQTHLAHSRFGEWRYDVLLNLPCPFAIERIVLREKLAQLFQELIGLTFAKAFRLKIFLRNRSRPEMFF